MSSTRGFTSFTVIRYTIANGFDMTVTFTPDNKNTPYHIRGIGVHTNPILASIIQQTEAFISNKIIFGDLLLQPAEFSFKDIYGKEFHLNNFKGSYVFINIWATWCKIYLEDFPLLEKIQEKYRYKPIKFVNISADKQSNKVRWK